MSNIRKFALLIVNDFDETIERIPLDFVDTPKNLGFELEFSTLESRLTTFFTSAREKKAPVTLNLYFLAPKAYEKAALFKGKIQTYLNNKMVLEYDDTYKVKYWEGKIQKLQQDELDQFKTLICPISFLPATPKYYRIENIIDIQMGEQGKNYPYHYPYTYGYTVIENDIIDNTYFDEIPIRATVYGAMTNPTISLQDADTGEVYSTVRFENLFVKPGEELIIDAMQSKILIKRNGKLYSAYDYLSKAQDVDSFLFAKANTTTKIVIKLDPNETGYLRASYHQYTL